MEQMYMIEMFIDKVTVYSDPKEESTARKKLIVTVRFGPKTEFVIKEGSFAGGKSSDSKDEDEKPGRKTVTRAIRVGKAYLFPSYPDTVLQVLDRFPLEISVWNDDENENREFVGIGTMPWDPEFYDMLRQSSDADKPSKPLTIQQITPLMDECCCGQVGKIAFILRLSALGGNIMTTFQQLPKDENSFVFTTDRDDNVFQCKRVEGDDQNFTMIGNLYGSVTIEDPRIISPEEKTVQICTQLDSCATDADLKTMFICGGKPKVKPVISKIRMGDIKGPCGNTNCTLAQKIKTYLRTTDIYKKKTAGGVGKDNKPKDRKVCGECICYKDQWHREGCPDKKKVSSNADGICHGCGGVVHSGVTCKNKSDCDDLAPAAPPYGGCRDIPGGSVCNCKAPEGKPLCGAFDCVCREEIVNKKTRKEHKSFCPSYKHKPSCPVTTMNLEVEPNVDDTKDDDEKEEPLPYGLPPIKLGPCPVTGRPCTAPDGFARMYKVQTSRPLPPSYGEAGKICCSKEFDRIRSFLKECMKEEVHDDFRCFNALEATASMSRCCDREQEVAKLAGKDCCGPHKAKGIPTKPM